MTTYKQLHELRKNKRESLRTLSLKTGLSTKTIMAAEKHGKVNFDTIERICEVLGCEVVIIPKE